MLELCWRWCQGVLTDVFAKHTSFPTEIAKALKEALATDPVSFPLGYEERHDPDHCVCVGGGVVCVCVCHEQLEKQCLWVLKLVFYKSLT